MIMTPHGNVAKRTEAENELGYMITKRYGDLYAGRSLKKLGNNKSTENMEGIGAL